MFDLVPSHHSPYVNIQATPVLHSCWHAPGPCTYSTWKSPLLPIVRPLNYPPIDCARIYSICNTTGVCGTAGADLQLHPMDGCITDRPTERPTDRPTDSQPSPARQTERQIPHHHHYSLSRLSCCRWGKSTVHLHTLSCSERAIGSRRNSFRLQVEVSMCRCRCRLQVQDCRSQSARGG